MDFLLAPSSLYEYLYLGGGMVILLIFSGTLFGVFAAFDRRRFILALISGAAALVSVGGLFTYALTVGGREEAWSSAVIAQIEDSYGLEISESELDQLYYPKEKPTEDFEVFGSFSADTPTESGFERSEVFLIWKDGALALAESTNGEDFTELEG